MMIRTNEGGSDIRVVSSPIKSESIAPVDATGNASPTSGTRRHKIEGDMAFV